MEIREIMEIRDASSNRRITVLPDKLVAMVTPDNIGNQK